MPGDLVNGQILAPLSDWQVVALIGAAAAATLVWREMRALGLRR